MEIQQARPDYALEHFVVGQHDTEPQQYAQCVLELQVKYDNIRRALLAKKKIDIEIRQLETKGDELSLIDAEMKRIDLEEQDRAMLGAWREFQALYRIWKSFEHKYTREELNNAQEEYWIKRLTRQANQEPYCQWPCFPRQPRSFAANWPSHSARIGSCQGCGEKIP